MAGITQKTQKRLIFIVVSQFRIADETWFVKKGWWNNIEDSNNNDTITKALNNHSENSICLLV